jgi:hypothetical protein
MLMRRKEKDLIPRTFAYLYMFAAQTGNGCCQEVVVQKNPSILECSRILHSRLVVACRAVGQLAGVLDLTIAYSATGINKVDAIQSAQPTIVSRIEEWSNLPHPHQNIVASSHVVAELIVE